MRIYFALPLLLAIFLAGCNETATQQGPKVGVADVSRLMRDSEPGKEGIKFLESLEEEVKGSLQEINARLEANPEDEAAIQELQTVYASAQQSIQIQGQNVAGALYDLLQKVLDQYRAEHGYDFILGQDTVVSFNPAIDVTNAIMAELNKQKIEFKPVATPALTPAPAQPAPAQAAPADEPEDGGVREAAPAAESADQPAEPAKAAE